MAQADLEINRNVRRVLVRHWLDLGRIFIRSTNGHVSLRGSLSRIHGMNDPINSATVDTIFTEIKRVRNVKNISPDLDNWFCERGAWKEKGEHPKDSAPSKPAQGSGGGTRSYIIGGNQEQ